MYFDLAAFLRYNFRSFFRTRNQHYRLTPKRLFALSIWLILYTPAQIINRFFFLLDEILYPAYRKQEVRQPIFIIGNPRSGTTFLHRMMDKDKQHFTSFAAWELIFAPSICQRKLIWGIGAIIRWLGAPVKKVISHFNNSLSFEKNAHKIKLDEAEEDGHLMVHCWASEDLWPIYPIKEEVFPYFFFDRDIPYEKRQKIMAFYKNMVQRHLYAHGGECILLSKNPSHTAKLASLMETFPDARFIDLARNPFESMPSMLNYMSAGWKVFCDPLEPYPHKDEFFEVMNFYYLYPVEFFQQYPDACNFIKYDELVSSPDEIIEDLYDWLDLEITDSFSEVIDQETEKARQFKSRHNYSIEEMGLSEAQIFENFTDVFAYYEFEPHEQELPDRTLLWQLRGWRQDWKTRRILRRSRRLQRRVDRRTRRRQRRLEPGLRSNPASSHNPNKPL